MKYTIHNLILLLGILLMAACQPKKAPAEQTTSLEGIHEVVAKDALYANMYTYVLVQDGQEEYWIATEYTEIEIGKNYYFDGRMEMKDFQSKDLDRHFDVVYFVDRLFEEPPQHDAAPASHLMSGRQPIEQVQGLSIEPAPGGISIAQLYAAPETFDGKKIILRGQVVKVNEGIMNRNWIHVQDGTSHDGKYDITITSNVLPKVGNTITLEGVVALQKDFGAGYLYEIIVEEGRVVPSAL